MSNTYNTLPYDQKDTDTSIRWKKIRDHFFQIMQKEFSLSTVKAKINPIKILQQPETTAQPYAPPQKYKTDSKAIESIKLLGVRIHLLTEEHLHDYIANVIEKGRKELILNVNVHCYNMIFKNPWLKDFLNKAEIIFCDGFGVALGAKLLGLRMPTRFTPADSIWNLAASAEKKGQSFYFLGAKHGIAEKAAQKMKERYPNLKITTYHGYFDKSRNSLENQKIISEINASKANILVVGFGMPIQEKWLEENWDELNVNIGFSAGALFDYVSGELRRGPRWMTDNGLEWLARLLIEPKRLWKRYLVGNTVFLYKVIAKQLENIMRGLVTTGQEMLTQTVGMGKKIFFPQPPVHVAETNNRRVDILTGRQYTVLRKHRRTQLNGYSAEIAKNGVRYNATIKNVSPEGIQLGNLPSFLTNQGDYLNVKISNLLGSMEYQLTVKTRWKKKADRKTAAGFSIVTAPNEWKMLMPQTATS